MPAGVHVEIDGPDAYVQFVDPALRGPSLARLLAVGGPESIEVNTRSGPRTVYRVPEGNAREAGLVDGADTPAEPSAPVSGDAGGSESATATDGGPDATWSRQQLNEYAKAMGLHPTDLPNKQAVLELIERAAKS